MSPSTPQSLVRRGAPWLLGMLAATALASPGKASTPSEEFEPAVMEEESADAQTSHGLELPVWNPGHFTDGFDTRLWPPAVNTWLEEENLRDLIRNASLPERERERLKRIYALRRAWRATG